MNPSQRTPLVAFTAAETLQAMVEQPGKVNAIFVAGRSTAAPSQAADDALAKAFQPTLADYGLSIAIHKSGYAQATSNRMLIEPAAAAAIHKAFAHRAAARYFHLPGQYDRRRRQGNPLLHDHGHRFPKRAAAGAVQIHRRRGHRPLGRRRNRAQRVGRRRPGRQAGRRNRNHVLRAREHARRSARGQAEVSLEGRSWRWKAWLPIRILRRRCPA